MHTDAVRSVPKIGLALSGGTLKAAAHIGVLGALEALGIRPQCVAGTSAGAFVAALYAHGQSTIKMARMVKEFPGIKLLDYGFPLLSSAWTLFKYRFICQGAGQLPLPSGLLRGVKLEGYIRKSLGNHSPEISYYMIATDLYTGADVVFGSEQPAEQVARELNEKDRFHHPDSETRLNQLTSKQRSPIFINSIPDPAKVIRASCSIPGILTPIEMDSYLLVDGGLREYVPVNVLRAAGCTHILAVNLYRLVDNWRPDTFAHVLSRSFDIIWQEGVDEDVDGPDVLSVLPKLSHIRWASVGDMELCIQAGRRAVAQNANQIRAFIANKGP